MDIGTRRQLFIDSRFFARSSGIELEMQTPVQHPDPVLLPDRPWESFGIGAYNTIMREPDGRFRMWYDAVMKGGLPSEGARRLCYAESCDGIHWFKPRLDLVPFGGRQGTNIVAPLAARQSMQGATVLRDQRAPAAARYRLWSKFRPADAEMEAGVKPGLWAFQSPDGFQWQPSPGQPNPPGISCDTQNMVFWDDRLDQYVGYIRVRETQSREEAAGAAKGRYRSVGRIASPDFIHWSALQRVFEADSVDLAIPVPVARSGPRPPIDFYTSCAMKYFGAEDVYLMLPSAFYHWEDDNAPNTMDVQLLVSRDGLDWQRAGGRRPFLRHGPDGTICSGMLFANPWLIPVDDEIWLYYAGTARRHGTDSNGGEGTPAARPSGIFRATLRRDGFVAATATYSGGEFTTPVLTFGGDYLKVNFDGSAGGWLQVEILDEHFRPVQGFSLADADAVTGNSVRKTVTWRGRSEVGSLRGRPHRLRLVMRDVRLYAFEFPASRALG